MNGPCIYQRRKLEKSMKEFQNKMTTNCYNEIVFEFFFFTKTNNKIFKSNKERK